MYSDFLVKDKIQEAIKKLFSNKIQNLLSTIGQFADQKKINCFAVGGFVRDLILKKANSDIDIVVEGDAIPFVTELAAELKLDFKIFDRFHTAKIYAEGIDIDFSSTRKEVYEHPGALPKVTFSDIHQDLYRRDFTINAMALTLNTAKQFEIIDFFGGLKDLESRIIRVMHAKSFTDDPTRLYRAIRFAHRFNFRMDNLTWKYFKKAIKDRAASTVSIKRVATEISKIFKEENPNIIIDKLSKNSLLKHFSNNVKIPPIKAGEIESLVSPDLEALYWISLLSQMPITFKLEKINQLGLPHSTRVEILDGLDALKKVPKALDEITCQDHIKLYYMLKKYCIESLVALAKFKLNKSNTEKIIYYLKNLRNIAPIITGKDLVNSSIPPGPHIRTILNYITELRLDGRSLTKLEELEIAKQLYANI